MNNFGSDWSSALTVGLTAGELGKHIFRVGTPGVLLYLRLSLQVSDGEIYLCVTQTI